MEEIDLDMTLRDHAERCIKAIGEAKGDDKQALALLHSFGGIAFEMGWNAATEEIIKHAYEINTEGN